MIHGPDDLVLLRVPVFSPLANAAFGLRHAVFVGEQNVPAEEENDADDLTATHLVALLGGEVVGTLRLLFRPDHAKIGRVAVARAHRGRGIATALMEAAIAHCAERGAARIELGAQTDKLGFYEKLGFTPYGGEFTDGGMPHRAMRRVL